jgi:phosphorylcholine metabolism protein LicD
MIVYLVLLLLTIYMIYKIYKYYTHKNITSSLNSNLTKEYKYIHNELLDLMKKTIIVFDKHNINYWAEGGTLLGCIREGKIIDTDDDIDLGLIKEDFLYIQNNKNNIINDLNKSGLHLVIRGDKLSPNKIVRLKKNGDYTKNFIFIDLMPFIKSNGKYKHTLERWQNDFFMEEELYPLKKGILNNIEINIPNNPIGNLERFYGDCSTEKCWKIPIQTHTHLHEINIQI